MNKSDIRKLCKKARDKGGYTTCEIILDLWKDDEDIPDKYLELFIQKVIPRPFIIYTSSEGAVLWKKALGDEYDRVTKDKQYE